jgi:xanthine dehydrogenase accessory factor
VGGGQFEHLLLDAAGDYFHNKSAGVEEFTLGRDADQCCGGRVTVFLEYVGPRQRVVIFGAGHVAKALAVTLAGAPFGLVVVDDRREWNTEENFPGATRLFDWDAGVAAALEHPEATMACVMTCSHETDLQLVQQLISAECLGYLGLIGSRSKRASFFTRLAGAGVPDERIQTIECPIGLGDMGKAPMSIAVSIAGRLLLKARELSDL